MRVLHIATHLAPLSGAPEGACLRFLVEAQGRRDVEVTVIVPCPEDLDPARYGLARRLDPLPVSTPGGAAEVIVFEGQLPSARARLFAVQGAELDDDLFGRATMAIAAEYHLRPDVVHAHSDRALPGLAAAAEAGIDARLATVRHPKGVDRGGLEHAARIVAPGPSCAEALRDADFAGAETAAFFTARADRLRGVSDGIEHLDPRYVAALPFHYWIDDMAGKAACKDRLQQALSLPKRPATPLVAFAPRTDADLELIAACGDELADLGAQIVFALDPAWGDSSKLRALAEAHPLVIGVLDDDGEAARHRVLGAADFSLEPAAYDWTAPSPLSCLRFGTMPVVRYDIGYSDMIVDFEGETGSGNAIAILEPTAQGVLAALRRAVKAFDQATFPSAVERAIGTDLSWRTAAHRYFEVYRELSDARLPAI